MATKFIAIACLIAAVECSDYNSHGPVQTSFAYGVLDPHTGDIKNQHETRNGDQVVGQYSFHESDGTKRTVDYTADAQNGFNAVVRKDPLYVHDNPVVTNVAPVVAIVAPMLANTYASSYENGYNSEYAAPLFHGYSNSYNPPLPGGYANGHAAPLNNEYSRGFNGYGTVPAPYIIGINA